MSEPAKKKVAYDDLYNVPDNMIGEIIDGELIVTPRPPRKHVIASSYLVTRLFKDEVKVRAEPFMEIEIDLSYLWRKARRTQSA